MRNWRRRLPLSWGRCNLERPNDNEQRCVHTFIDLPEAYIAVRWQSKLFRTRFTHTRVVASPFNV